MPVRIRLDDAHHRGAGLGATDHGHQMPHIVAHRREVDDRLRRILTQRGLIIRLALR